jgi:hypothetical protein
MPDTHKSLIRLLHFASIEPCFIDETAEVDPTAKIGPNVSIGELAKNWTREFVDHPEPFANAQSTQAPMSKLGLAAA